MFYSVSSVFDSPLSREQVVSRLQSFNGDYGRDGAEFEGQTFVSSVDAKGFRVVWPIRPGWLRRGTATARWLPTATGSRFHLRVMPVISRKALATKMILIAIATIIGFTIVLLVFHVLNIQPPAGAVVPIGLVTPWIMILGYVIIIDPTVSRRTIGAFENHQVEQFERFVAEVLDARLETDGSPDVTNASWS